VPDYIVGHGYAKRLTVIASGAKVNAGKHAGILDFLEGGVKAWEGSNHSEHDVGLHADGSVLAKLTFEHSSSCAAGAGVAGWILGMVWRRKQRLLGWVRYGVGISVRVSQGNRRDRPPSDIVAS
jgi:hypothetical protein